MTVTTAAVTAAAPAAGIGSLLLLDIAVALIGYLHLVSGLSPVRRMVSDYVFTSAGAVLLPLAVLAFAAALLVLLCGLAAAGLADRRIGVALVVAALGAVVVALCRPDDGSATLLGLCHRAGGGALFGGVPAAGWALSGSPRLRSSPQWRALVPVLRLLTAVSGALFAVFLVIDLPGYGVPLPAASVLVDIRGLLERCLLVPDVVLVGLIAARLAIRRPAVEGGIR